jgi:hypothetical protein
MTGPRSRWTGIPGIQNTDTNDGKKSVLIPVQINFQFLAHFDTAKHSDYKVMRGTATPNPTGYCPGGATCKAATRAPGGTTRAFGGTKKCQIWLKLIKRLFQAKDSEKG